MCGIFCSFKTDKLEELSRLNVPRGNKTFSVSYIYSNLVHVRRFDSGFDITKVEPKSGYKICHVQAPTTNSKNIHPAKVNNKMFLWHNGMIKNDDVSRLQKKQGNNEIWDTQLLLNELIDQNHWSDNLSEIRGSFACLFLHNEKLYTFRNQLAPLFIDDDCNISSVKFGSSVDVEPDVIHEINLFEKTIKPVISFTTKENPYFF